MPNRCVAPGCKVNYDSCKEKCSMFAAPKEEERRLLWQRANPRKDFVLKPSHYLCEKHFHEENIVRKITHKDQSDKIIAQKCPVEEGEVVEDPLINENKSTADDQVPVIVEFIQSQGAVKGAEDEEGRAGARRATRKESARRLYERIAASACAGEAPEGDPTERALKRKILETELEIRREELSFKRSLHRLQLEHEARANSVRLQALEQQLGGL